MCKHVAAVFYGVGARLDAKPELLFAFRGVNHEELIAADAEKAVAKATSRGKSKRLATAEIGEVFGIEIDGNGHVAEGNGDGTGIPRIAADRRSAKKLQANKKLDRETPGNKRKSARSRTKKRSPRKA